MTDVSGLPPPLSEAQLEALEPRWWAVHHERVAVRDRPSRDGNALYVFNTGALLRGYGAEEVDGKEWVRLCDYELLFFGTRARTGWVLVDDPALGLKSPLIQTLPEGSGAMATELLDATVHPQSRAIVAVEKAKEQGRLPKDDAGTASVPSGGVPSAQGAPPAEHADGDADDEGEDEAEADQAVATYAQAAGPPRPPSLAPEEISRSKSVFKDGGEVD